MQQAKSIGAAIILLLVTHIALSQQLKLGNNPYTVEKSAILELQSTNQGLLFPRIADTLLINALVPPDGMVIFFTPIKELLVRTNGSWRIVINGTSIVGLNGLAASTQTFALGTTGTDFNIASAGSVHTFNIPDASAAARGLITTGTQNIAGSKTFSSAPVFSSLTQGSVPFIGSGGLLTQNNANFFWDATNSRLGLGTAAPSTRLHVTGANPLTLTGVQAGTSTTADSLLTITNGLIRKLPMSTFATPITTGNLTETGSSILTIMGGTGAVVGSGTTLQVKQASGSQSGFLSSTDWTTFNNKLSTVDTTNIASFSFKVRSLFGAGTGITYNAATGVFSTSGSSTGWLLTGNAGTAPATNFLGTTDAQSLAFRTNNAEEMRLFNGGGLAIGATALDGSNPEALLVDAGTTLSYNAISAKGSINNYLQLNIQNRSSGTVASSDLVATADNGSEAGNYVDLGINSSGFTNATYPIIGGINNAYLYSTGNDFVIGNAIASKNLRFFTGGYANTNEAMRIDGTGNVGVATTEPAAKLDVGGTYKLGAKGSVNKNAISISAAIPGGTTAAAGTMTVIFPNSYAAGVTDVNFTIPAGQAPTTNVATVVVTPAFDLPGSVSIASARLTTATNLRVRFLNASTTSQSLSGTLYFTITEF